MGRSPRWLIFEGTPMWEGQGGSVVHRDVGGRRKDSVIGVQL